MVDAVLPQKDPAERLDALTQERKPDNVTYTLALDNKHTLNETMKAAADMFDDLKVIAENNYSTDGLEAHGITSKNCRIMTL